MHALLKIEEDVPPVEAPMKGESVVQAEDAAHNEDTAKANKNKRANIFEKAHKALKEKAKDEGKTVDQKATEMVEEKANSPFPADAQINEYSFLHFRKSWLENLGRSNGVSFKVEKNTDGSITLRKA
jgi:hypothetical protein